ncbi:MAG: GEVED domain-containing protein [Flavobacteriales bacterium]|nr:GEVED domain-containing protein [Flavobacteriales bacterium]
MMDNRPLRYPKSRRWHPGPWAAPLAVAAALAWAAPAQAQVAQYTLTYDKLLQTSSMLQADEDAAFEPITGGTVLADGTQAAQAAGTIFGVGYIEYETVGGFFGNTTRPKDFLGNASFVGNTPGNADGSQAEYQVSGAPVLKTGPGYPIGFNFTYNGQTFDRVGISGQGWIGFGNSADGATAVGVYTSGLNSTSYLPLSNTTLLANDNRRNRVVATGVSGGSFNVGTNTMPIVYDPTYPAYPGAELRYETIGTAPNRVFVVQWRNYGFTINSIDQQYYRRMDFQIRLYETTNEVEVRFGKAWRSNTTAVFQTGVGGKTATEYKTFGFYDAGANTWRGWPYAFTSQANHNGYPGSTELGQRIPWTGVQGYFPYNNFGSGSAQDYYAAIFHEMSPLESSPYNVASQTISGTKANTPDMMSFTWTPASCLVAVSGVTASNPGPSSATLNWTNTGDVDYAVSTGNDPNAAPFTGTVSGSSVNLTGLAGSTVYRSWVRTNCGGGQTSVWIPGPTFNTLPCPVPASIAYGVMAITSVQIADINNASTNTTSTFEDFTSVVGNVESPLSYPITVTANNPYNEMYATAFFDWDQDGVFDDTQQIGGFVTANPAVFTGTINISPAALAGNCRMRIVVSYSEVAATACSGPGWGGQTEDYMLNVTPATCIPPSASSMSVSNILAHSADLAWSASVGGNIVGYAWEVRSSGNPGDPAPAASGTTLPGVTTASATGLVANTVYTFYVRSDCGTVDGLSVWMNKTFTTELGCGSTWVSPGGVNNLSDAQFTQTHTICPDNAGDVVTVDFTAWNGLRWNAPNASRMYIFDGDNTSAPMVPGGNGPAYSGSEWTIPAGGWTSTNAANKPPIYTSTALSGCLTVQVYNAGIWTGGMGWSADFTCAPRPTCFPPEDLAVTATTVNDASFSWDAGASPNVEYKVVAFGGLPGDAAITTGTSTTGSATTAATLAANTKFTVYFRGLCDDQGVGDDPSAWSPGLNFTTKIGCGGPYDLYSSTAYAAYSTSPNPTDSTITICPNNAGDVVTMTISKFSFNGGNSNAVGLFVHNGNSTAAPIFNSGKPAMSSGSYTLAPGAFWGTAYNPTATGGVAPGPFTSTAPDGCLTLHFQAFSGYTYDQGMKSMVSCGPAPACSTPDNITVTGIGGNSATISWGNASQPAVIEYGPVGFTPGTGATAGVDGTVLDNQTSPATITGLSATTKYEVYVRQDCNASSDGFSANSFKAFFATSMDCSTAQVITCGQFIADDDAPAQYATGNAVYEHGNYTNAVSCLGANASANGPERLYRFTATEAGTYGILGGISDMGGTSKIGYAMARVEDGCAASAFTCIGQIQANTGGIANFTITAPGDYYIISDANYQIHKRPFTLACPGVPACASAPTFPANGSTLAVNTNQIAFSWPAVFGATGYDVYFQGSLVVANYPGTTISDAQYTTANMKALFGIGTPIHWSVVPTNSYGTPTCTTDWTFSVGGNGAANAISLTDGVAYNGNSYTANGYSSQENNFWGNDAWYKFTASNCADSAAVSVCLPSSAAATYIALVIRRASDNAVVFPPANDASYYAYVNAGGCFEYSWFNDDPEVWNWVYETPTIEVIPGESYYVIVDGYNSGIDFTAAYNEISNSPDSDGDGILDCADDCPFTPGVVGSACDVEAGFTAAFINADCECVQGNMAVVSITTDGSPEQLSWEVTNETYTVVASGTPAQANTTVSETVFLPGTCYSFKLMDSFGDGITSGGWEVRNAGGQLILRDAFSSGSQSPSATPATASYGTGHSFCLPAGPSRIMANECNVFTNGMYDKVYCSKVTGATQYQFEFSDPDAGYMRRIARPHNYVVFYEMVSSPLVPGVVYFTRVRTNEQGPLASAHWGSGCDLGLGIAQVVQCTQLIQAPAYGHSCGETRSFTAPYNYLYARPVTGATTYTFKITGDDGNYNGGIEFVRNTYILALGWGSAEAPALLDQTTYQVEVRVTVNGIEGAYCGNVCNVTIDNNPGLGMRLAQTEGQPEFNLWPNPNNGQHLNVALSGLDSKVSTADVRLMDLTGRVALGTQLNVVDGAINSVIELGNAANGTYLLQVIAGGKTYTQRVVVSK